MAASNLEALKALYTALGGEADLSAATTSVDVLNAIAELYEGEGDATLNAEAIANISEVVTGGGSKLTNKALIKRTTFNGTLTIMHLTQNGTLHVADLGTEAVECYLPTNDGDTPLMGAVAILYGASSLDDLQPQAQDADIMLLLDATSRETAAVYIEAETSGIEIDLAQGGIQI